MSGRKVPLERLDVPMKVILLELELVLGKGSKDKLANAQEHRGSTSDSQALQLTLELQLTVCCTQSVCVYTTSNLVPIRFGPQSEVCNGPLSPECFIREACTTACIGLFEPYTP